MKNKCGTITALSSAVLLAAGIACGAAQGTPAQNTGPNLAGEWKTVSLTQNRIGYELNLRKAGTGNSTYLGTLQFRHRDGRKPKSVKVTLAVGVASKDIVRVTMVMPGGALTSGKGIVSGRLSTTDGSMYFPKCSQVWPLAMKGEEDTDCLFRELPD